jgi:hypothetical protein
MDSTLIEALNHTEKTEVEEKKSRCVHICNTLNKTCLIVILLFIVFINDLIDRFLNSDTSNNLLKILESFTRNKTE